MHVEFGVYRHIKGDSEQDPSSAPRTGVKK
jgi:hypothetical protein